MIFRGDLKKLNLPLYAENLHTNYIIKVYTLLQLLKILRQPIGSIWT